MALMKHVSLLALLPSGATVAPATGPYATPAAPDLAAYVLSHERYDAAENAPSARKDYKNVHVADVMTDEYVFPLGETGKSIVLSGYQIAAGFLAERAADEWLELARQQHAANGGADNDGTRHVPDPAEADQLMDRALESAERILAPFEAAPVVSLFETHYRGAREFLRLSWEGLPEDLVPKSRRPAVVSKAAADLAPASARQDYDPYGLEGTSDYDVDKPLAYREKTGPFLLTMTYRHEYPQVDDERAGLFPICQRLVHVVIAGALQPVGVVVLSGRCRRQICSRFRYHGRPSRFGHQVFRQTFPAQAKKFASAAIVRFE